MNGHASAGAAAFGGCSFGFRVTRIIVAWLGVAWAVWELLGVQGLRCRVESAWFPGGSCVCGLRFRVQGSGLRVEGLGFRVQGLGFGVSG